MKDVPKWDTSKHYFDQKVLTLQFYEEEMRKITEGVNIGGYKMHPFMYFHLNFFQTPVPTKMENGTTKDIMGNPPLDDNLYYIIESLKEAQERQKVLFLFGCRGFAKTTFIASYTQHTVLTKPDGNFSIIGGDEGDLKSITSLIDKSLNRINPAFFLPSIKKDWDDYVSFGYKDKSTSGKTYVHSEIRITNAGRGASGSSEKGAGLSPIGYIMDEVGKYSFRAIFESAIPSFKTPHGYKLIPILSGTSGNTTLSKDAREVLENPDVYDVLPMNYDRLNNFVDPDEITWSKDKKFGTFVPGQMSYRLTVPKISKSFGEFVKIPTKELKALKINVTDWKNARESVQALGGAGAKESTKNKNKMYYPLDTDDCFLTTTPNPLPVAIIDRRIRELEQTAMSGRSVDIIREGSEYKTIFSAKTKASVIHPGGNIDAPIVIYDEVPEQQPEKYTFVSGLDDYKLNDSDTDSLGAFYVIKRRNLELNNPCETIHASYVSRPERHNDFHATCENLIEMWAAECFMEAVDVSFEEYLEGKKKAAKWLAPAVTFAKSKDARSNAKLQKKYGLFPTAGNNEYRMNILVDWCWEQHTVGIDDSGREIVKYSVEFIDDIELLQELRDWQKGKNSDRKEAFSHALLYAHLLDVDNVRPKSLKHKSNVLRSGASYEDQTRMQNKPAKQLSPYSMRSRSPYRR